MLERTAFAVGSSFFLMWKLKVRHFRAAVEMVGLSLAVVAAREEGRAFESVLPDAWPNDPERWRLFYETHYPFVHRIARHLGTPAAEADDVAQEVFMVVMDRASSFKGGRLDSWLYRITANVSSHHHRKRRTRQAVAVWRERLGLDFAGVRTPDVDAITRDQSAAVERILERMNTKRREVFALYELEGMSGEDIAARLDWPLGTVWSRLRLARRDFHRIGRKLGLLERDSI